MDMVLTGCPTYARVRPRTRKPVSLIRNSRQVLANAETLPIPPRGISVHKDAEYHLSKRELERLIGAAENERDRALITLFVETGIRRFETAKLVTADLDVKHGILIVRNGKGRKLRMLPLSPRLLERLRSICGANLQTPLFRTARSGPLSTRQINRIVAAAGARAGIRNPNPRQKNVTCHLLRHSFARHWKEVGGNIETLAKILGHASVKTTWDLYGTQSVDDVIHYYRTTITKITNPKKGEGA